MPFHISMYLCLHCGHVFNSHSDCATHEEEEHGEGEAGSVHVFDAIQQMCKKAMINARVGEQARQPPPVAEGGTSERTIREMVQQRSTTPQFSPVIHAPPFTIDDEAPLLREDRPTTSADMTTEQVDDWTEDGMKYDPALVTSSSIFRQTNRQSSLPRVPCKHCHRMISAMNMKRHVLIHTGEKPYECRVCGQRFNQPSTRVQHCWRIHGVDCRRQDLPLKRATPQIKRRPKTGRKQNKTFDGATVSVLSK